MKFKKKKKGQMGWFYNMSPGNPEYNAEMFNHLMGSGEMPSGSTMGVSEEFNRSNEIHPIPQNCKIETTKGFERDFKKLKLTPEDLVDLKKQLKHKLPKAALGGANTMKFA